MKLIMENWNKFVNENQEEREWSGRDPYEDDSRIDATPIPDDQLTPAQKLSDEVEAFKKKYWLDLSTRELDYVNFIEDGLYSGFPRTAQKSKEQYMQEISDALKNGDEGLLQYFKT